MIMQNLEGDFLEGDELIGFNWRRLKPSKRLRKIAKASLRASIDPFGATRDAFLGDTELLGRRGKRKKFRFRKKVKRGAPSVEQDTSDEEQIVAPEAPEGPEAPEDDAPEQVEGLGWSLPKFLLPPRSIRKMQVGKAIKEGVGGLFSKVGGVTVSTNPETGEVTPDSQSSSFNMSGKMPLILGAAGAGLLLIMLMGKKK